MPAGGWKWNPISTLNDAAENWAVTLGDGLQLSDAAGGVQRSREDLGSPKRWNPVSR